MTYTIGLPSWRRRSLADSLFKKKRVCVGCLAWVTMFRVQEQWDGLCGGRSLATPICLMICQGNFWEIYTTNIDGSCNDSLSDIHHDPNGVLMRTNGDHNLKVTLHDLRTPPIGYTAWMCRWRAFAVCQKSMSGERLRTFGLSCGAALASIAASSVSV